MGNRGVYTRMYKREAVATGEWVGTGKQWTGRALGTPLALERAVVLNQYLGWGGTCAYLGVREGG